MKNEKGDHKAEVFSGSESPGEKTTEVLNRLKKKKGDLSLHFPKYQAMQSFCPQTKRLKSFLLKSYIFFFKMLGSEICAGNHAIDLFQIIKLQNWMKVEYAKK